MKKVILILSLFSLVYNCAKPLQKPDNLISEDKMVEIMSDLYLYQQSHFVNYYQNNDIKLNEVDVEILNSHNVNVADFKQNFIFYVKQPEKYKNILTRVRDGFEQKLPEDERNALIQERKQ